MVLISGQVFNFLIKVPNQLLKINIFKIQEDGHNSQKLTPDPPIIPSHGKNSEESIPSTASFYVTNQIIFNTRP